LDYAPRWGSEWGWQREWHLWNDGGNSKRETTWVFII